MVIPDAPYFPYYRILEERIGFETWWKQYTRHHTDYLEKISEEISYNLKDAPRRWYSRSVINLYTPVERNSPKLCFRFSLDYESIIIGTALGMFLIFRRFMDFHYSKSYQYRPGDSSVCSGRNNHFFLKWNKTHINPKKYFAHDRKIFWRKFLSGLPEALLIGTVGALFCHVYSALTYNRVERQYPLYVAAILMIHEIHLDNKKHDVLDMHYNVYRDPELYGLGFLVAYSLWSYFRNYSANIPCQRVLFG